MITGEFRFILVLFLSGIPALIGIWMIIMKAVFKVGSSSRIGGGISVALIFGVLHLTIWGTSTHYKTTDAIYQPEDCKLLFDDEEVIIKYGPDFKYRHHVRTYKEYTRVLDSNYYIAHETEYSVFDQYVTEHVYLFTSSNEPIQIEL